MASVCVERLLHHQATAAGVVFVYSLSSPVDMTAAPVAVCAWASHNQALHLFAVVRQQQFRELAQFQGAEVDWGLCCAEKRESRLTSLEGRFTLSTRTCTLMFTCILPHILCNDVLCVAVTCAVMCCGISCYIRQFRKM